MRLEQINSGIGMRFALPSTTSLTSPRIEEWNRNGHKRWLKYAYIYLILNFVTFWGCSIIFCSTLFLDCNRGHKWIAHGMIGSLGLLFVLIDIIFYNTCLIKKRGTEKCCRLSLNNPTFEVLFELTSGYVGYVDIYTDLTFIFISFDGISQMDPGIWRWASLIAWIISLLDLLFLLLQKLSSCLHFIFALSHANAAQKWRKALYFAINAEIRGIGILLARAHRPEDKMEDYEYFRLTDLNFLRNKLFGEDALQSISQIIIFFAFYAQDICLAGNEVILFTIIWGSTLISIICSILALLFAKQAAKFKNILKAHFFDAKEKWFTQMRNVSQRIPEICEALIGNTELESLHFAYCELQEDVHIKAICDGVDAATNLTHLFVDFNELTCRSACIFGTKLRNDERLLELDLSSNMIGQTGFIALSQALRENKVLLILNMSYNLVNEFESDWATELGTALEENITLEHLKLNHLLMNNDHLNRILSSKITLLQLEICENHITNEGVNQIIGVLREISRIYKPKELLKINFDGNSEAIYKKI